MEHCNLKTGVYKVKVHKENVRKNQLSSCLVRKIKYLNKILKSRSFFLIRK